MGKPCDEKEFLLKVFEIVNENYIKQEDNQAKIEYIKNRFKNYKELYERYNTINDEDSIFQIHEYIDLRKEPFMGLRKKCTGCNADFWLVLGDLKTYMLKQILNNKFLGKGNQERTVMNCTILPVLIEKTRYGICKVLQHHVL